MNQPYITPQELSKLAAIPYQRVLRDIKDGQLPALSFGGNYAISAQDAQEYIATGGEEITEANVKRLEAQLAQVKARLAAKLNAQRRAA